MSDVERKSHIPKTTFSTEQMEPVLEMVTAVHSNFRKSDRNAILEYEFGARPQTTLIYPIAIDPYNTLLMCSSTIDSESGLLNSIRVVAANLNLSFYEVCDFKRTEENTWKAGGTTLALDLGVPKKFPIGPISAITKGEAYLSEYSDLTYQRY